MNSRSWSVLGFEDTKPVLEAIKNKGITTIGAAGICWGEVVVELSKLELIQAAVLIHPTFVTVDDIKGGKAPIAILGAKIDHWTSSALVKQFEETLASKPEVPSYVKIHPKVSHGWTVSLVKVENQWNRTRLRTKSSDVRRRAIQAPNSR